MDRNLTNAILVKYALQRPLTHAEIQLLNEFRSRSDEHNALPDQLRDPAWREEHRRVLKKAPTARMWENIRRDIRASPDKVRLMYLRQWRRRIVWRSVIAIVIGTVILLSMEHFVQAVNYRPSTRFLGRKSSLQAILHKGNEPGFTFDHSQGYIDTLEEQGTEIPITWKFIHDRIDSTNWNVGISFYINHGYHIYGVTQNWQVVNQPTVMAVDLGTRTDGRRNRIILDKPIEYGKRKVEKAVLNDGSYVGQNYYEDSARFVSHFSCSPDSMKHAYLLVIFQWCDQNRYYPFREWFYKIPVNGSNREKAVHAKGPK